MLCYARTDNPPYARYLGDVLHHIREKSLQQPDERKLYEAAVNGMLSQLDPYTGYSPPVEAVELDEEINQRLTGIGVQVAFDAENRPLVISPIRDGPAMKAGVRAGDRILAVNGESVLQLNMDGLVQRIKGPYGSRVQLTLLAEDSNHSRDVQVVRTDVRVASVIGDSPQADGSWKFTLEGEPTIGYARILEFGRYTGAEIAEVCNTLSEKKVERLILDLRGNTGGLLEAAVATCDLFIDEGVIVSQRDRNGKQVDIYEATGRRPSYAGKLAVLVDGGTASASEIVAGCLQDHYRATIIGSRTYGKGTVQDIIPIERRRAFLRLTTSGYWRPSGKNIHRAVDSKPSDIWGVMPDAGMTMEVNQEQQEAAFLARRGRDFPVLDRKNPVTWEKLLAADAVLARGVEVLK